MSNTGDTGGAPLLVRLQDEQIAARREQHKERVLLLGMVISEVKNRALELTRPLSDDDVIDVIRKGIKKRRESVELYNKASRQDLADKEQAEVEMLSAYLPPEVDASEIRKAVKEAIAGGAGNIGAVMGRVMPRFKGRVDGSVINAIAREALADKQQ